MDSKGDMQTAWMESHCCPAPRLAPPQSTEAVERGHKTTPLPKTDHPRITPGPGLTMNHDIAPKDVEGHFHPDLFHDQPGLNLGYRITTFGHVGSPPRTNR